MAVSTILSNTGRASVGDWLMTRRISAVAVCRASASCVSLMSRAFFIAICAWPANACASAICLSRIGPHLVASEGENPDDSSGHRRSGTMRTVRAPSTSTLATIKGTPLLVGLRRLEVLDVEKGSILGVATQEVRGGHGLEVGARGRG